MNFEVVVYQRKKVDDGSDKKHKVFKPAGWFCAINRDGIEVSRFSCSSESEAESKKEFVLRNYPQFAFRR